MEEKMFVKVIKRYNDISLGKIQEVGTVLEVTEARGKYLIKQGMVVKCEKAAEKENETGGKKKNEKQNAEKQVQDSDGSAAVR